MHRLLVCFGNAEYGRLGLGSGALAAVSVPRVVLALANYDLDSVAAGGAHTAVVTRGGLLFTFGLNSRGQLGHSPGADFAADPSNVLIPEPVTAVAAGEAHTLCLTESGRVYAFGCNARGQLGTGPPDTAGPAALRPGASSASSASASARGAASGWCSPRPRLVKALEGQRVVSIAAGSAHSLAATRDGRLFAWGSTANGRLGNGSVEDGPDGSRAGQEAETGSEAETRMGDGGNAAGEDGAGGGPRPWVQWLPRRVNHGSLQDALVARVFAGPATSAAVDENGRVHTWGLGRLQQLGHGGRGRDEWEPRLVDVPSLRQTLKVALGAGHALACRQDQRVHVWGSDPAGAGCLGFGPMGPLGPFAAPGLSQEPGGRPRGPDPGVLVPRPTLFKFWFTDVGAGLSHSAGISSDGRLYTWGWGGALRGAGAADLPRLSSGSDPEHGAAFESGPAADPKPGAPSAVLRLGGGQLGVGSGVNLPTPTLVTKLELLPGEVLRQDNGDPFNYQDSNLGWLFRQVACGHNHTAALIQVARSWTGAIQTRSHEVHFDKLAPAGGPPGLVA